MRFYLPDWDDRVDPGFDFRSERFTLGRDPYRDDRYAHELFPERVYDGILVSRMALGERGPKRELCERIGIRHYLRLPPELDTFGDCGAWGYLHDAEPRYEPEELVAYYDRLRFDLGTSVDHAIVPQVAAQRERRYALTIRNAERFLAEHRRVGARFVPVGAVQGWDVASYLAAGEALVELGYDYLAIGGLARATTARVREVVTALRERLPEQVRLHVFGIARLELLAAFQALGIASVDSATPMRQAWLAPWDNYVTPARAYAAVRIPIAEQERARAGTLVERSTARLAELRAAERQAMVMVRGWDAGRERLPATLAALMDYDALLAERIDRPSRDRRRELYHETLRDRAWRRCPCAICRALGIEVVLFRGNNRNRRRGFHNMWTLYRLLHARG